MFYLIKHSYATVFSCHPKVFEYLQKHIHCRIEKIRNKYVICFGVFDTKAEALDAKQALADKGVTARIYEVKR